MSDQRSEHGRTTSDDELRARLRELELLQTLCTRVASTCDLPSLYDLALDAVIEAAGAERAALLLFDDDGVIRFKAWHGLSDAYREAVEGHCPWDCGAPASEPLLVGDVHDDDDLAGFGELFDREGIGALAFIPLRHDGGVIGKFMAYYPQPREFPKAEVRLLESVASHVSIALQRQRGVEALLASQQELGAMQARVEGDDQVRNLAKALTLAEQRERRRLSQVLHDDLQQILYGVEMRLHILGDEVTEAGATDPLQRSIREVRELLARAIHVTRTISVELNPPVLAGEDLAASLEWLVRHMADQHELEVELAVDEGIVELGVELRGLLIQIVRELLFNVALHAGVQRAKVVTEQRGCSLRIVVEDAGRGFDLERLRRDDDRRLGLFGIEDRIRLFGGEIKVRSRADQGTRVTVRVPLDRLERAHGTEPEEVS